MEFIALLLFIGFLNWTINKLDKKKTTNSNSAINPIVEKSTVPVISEHIDLAEKISGYFKKKKLKYWLSEDRDSFRTGFNLDDEGFFDMFINIHDNHISFVCEVINPIGDEVVVKTTEITSRINQYYNFGQVNFFFESRVVVFKIVYPLFQNELNENKFEMYVNGALDGARNCRHVINKVLIEGEEPAIAVMNI